MPVSAKYDRDVTHLDQHLEQKREKIFNLLMQENKPRFGETSASYQYRIDVAMIDLAVVNHPWADTLITDMLKRAAKREEAGNQAALNKKYQKRPDGSFLTYEGALVKKVVRTPLRFTAEQVHLMIALREDKFSYVEIAKYVRNKYGLTKQQLTDQSVRGRILQGAPKAKKKYAAIGESAGKRAEAIAAERAAKDLEREEAAEAEQTPKAEQTPEQKQENQRRRDSARDSALALWAD